MPFETGKTSFSYICQRPGGVVDCKNSVYIPKATTYLRLYYFGHSDDDILYAYYMYYTHTRTQMLKSKTNYNASSTGNTDSILV